MIWGFVGGRDFDAHGLAALLESVPPTDIVAVGSGLGSEKFVREQGPELGLDVRVAPLRTASFDWPVDEVVPPPVPQTRLMMLIRLDQAMLWGEARKAEREGEKTKGALGGQVADVVAACLDGKLVVMGEGRAKQALAIVNRVQEIPTYNSERTKVSLTRRWEVIEL